MCFQLQISNRFLFLTDLDLKDPEQQTERADIQSNILDNNNNNNKAIVFCGGLGLGLVACIQRL